jgi:hypothetical protein
MKDEVAPTLTRGACGQARLPHIVKNPAQDRLLFLNNLLGAELAKLAGFIWRTVL